MASAKIGKNNERRSAYQAIIIDTVYESGWYQ